ncbi:MAG: alpha/beta hydrolase [Chloroflexi bacterium]|nr:alpha/beta hydrolase [Chloroflexota bacterium]
MKTFEFPVGYHRLHRTKIIDFQLNRWISLGYTRLEDMRDAAAKIDDLPDWKDEMVRQAEKALAEGRLMNATFSYRAAEFFTHPSDPDKLKLYETFLDLFYNQLFADEPIERHQVPYAGTVLPALRLPSAGELERGTLVMHGGFDSFIEEFYSMATFFAAHGYEVIMFDGPGQGGALKHSHLPMDLAWEKPTAAVLDSFDCDDVTLLGLSMGGWLCFRAAAFEPRIERVIASSIAFDYMQIPPKPVADFARWLMNYPKLMNTMSGWKMQMMPQEKWGIDNLMYMTHADTPFDASKKLIEFNEANQHPDRVTQDVLILTGEADHFIPAKMHPLQVAALRNARSMTERIFTEAEQAHNHCQVGNVGLALDVMVTWMDEKVPAPAAPVPLPGAELYPPPLKNNHRARPHLARWSLQTHNSRRVQVGFGQASASYR